MHRVSYFGVLPQRVLEVVGRSSDIHLVVAKAENPLAEIGQASHTRRWGVGTEVGLIGEIADKH